MCNSIRKLAYHELLDGIPMSGYESSRKDVTVIMRARLCRAYSAKKGHTYGTFDVEVLFLPGKS